ncbi:hypothetical protein Droror1_Dr00023209 [Drosera rotundifolia]
MRTVCHQNLPTPNTLPASLEKHLIGHEGTKRVRQTHCHHRKTETVRLVTFLAKHVPALLHYVFVEPKVVLHRIKDGPSPGCVEAVLSTEHHGVLRVRDEVLRGRNDLV